jgi:hypothetical protein
MNGDLISIGKFRTRPYAQKAKHILDHVGIESVISSDPASIGRYSPQAGDQRFPMIDAAYLMVRPQDIDKAKEALRRRSR